MATNDSKPAGSHEELVMELAEKTDVSPKQARDLIEKHGTDREALFEVARTMKAEG